MRGLLAKEWCVICKNSVSTFVIILLFAVVGVFSQTIFLFAYIAVFLSVIPVNYIAFDETSRWEQYALALPYKRSMIVSAKYISMLMIAGAATVITAVGLLVRMQKDGIFHVEHFALYLTVTFAAGILLPSIAFPFIFKFGSAKGRILMVLATCCLASFLSIGFMDYAETITTGTGRFIGELNTYAAIPMILLAAAVICALSWCISAAVYEKKEL